MLNFGISDNFAKVAHAPPAFLRHLGSRLDWFARRRVTGWGGPSAGTN